MIQPKSKALLWGLAVAAFLRFGLEPTGWLFYHASFISGIDSLYIGYQIFRGAGHFFNLWPHQLIACLFIGMLVAGMVYLISARRRRKHESS